MPGGHCAERRRVKATGNFRCGRISVAPSRAFVVADAVGEDAIDAGRAGVFHSNWNGELRSARAGGERVSGRSVGIEIEGDVSGVKVVISAQWPEKVQIAARHRKLLGTDHWPLFLTGHSDHEI